jgi:hypothetical protein
MSVINDLVYVCYRERGNMRDTCTIAGCRALSHLSHVIVYRCVILARRDADVLTVAPQYDREGNDNK